MCLRKGDMLRPSACFAMRCKSFSYQFLTDTQTTPPLSSIVLIKQNCKFFRAALTTSLHPASQPASIIKCSSSPTSKASAIFRIIAKQTWIVVGYSGVCVRHLIKWPINLQEGISVYIARSATIILLLLIVPQSHGIKLNMNHCISA